MSGTEDLRANWKHICKHVSLTCNVCDEKAQRNEMVDHFSCSEHVAKEKA
jgi:hypothetical protein